MQVAVVLKCTDELHLRIQFDDRFLDKGSVSPPFFRFDYKCTWKQRQAGPLSLTSDVGVSEGEGWRAVALGAAAVVIVIVIIVVVVVPDAALGVDAALQTVTLVADADTASERVAEAALLTGARKGVGRVRAVGVVTAWITHALVSFCGKNCTRSVCLPQYPCQAAISS